MKLDDVLPALREGKSIRRTNKAWQEAHICIDKFAMRMCHEICCLDLVQDDWEVIE